MTVLVGSGFCRFFEAKLSVHVELKFDRRDSRTLDNASYAEFDHFKSVLNNFAFGTYSPLLISVLFDNHSIITTVVRLSCVFCFNSKRVMHVLRHYNKQLRTIYGSVSASYIHF